jgi:hypothetical protein
MRSKKSMAQRRNKKHLGFIIRPCVQSNLDAFLEKHAYLSFVRASQSVHDSAALICE